MWSRGGRFRECGERLQSQEPPPTPVRLTRRIEYTQERVANLVFDFVIPVRSERTGRAAEPRFPGLVGESTLTFASLAADVLPR